jgi:hypothetical protein
MYFSMFQMTEKITALTPCDLYIYRLLELKIILQTQPQQAFPMYKLAEIYYFFPSKILSLLISKV